MGQRKPTEPAVCRREPEETGRTTERRRAIITGATGFIGTALCRELLLHDYEVIAVIRPGSTRKKKLEDMLKSALQKNPTDREVPLQVSYSLQGEERGMLQLEELALEELSRLAEQGIQADVLYHLAWNGSSGAAREQFEVQVSNLAYTAEAIRTAKRCGCGTFIGAGSQAEYGIIHGRASETETVPKPFMMYGAAKLAAYQTGRLVAEQEEIAFIWPRIYSIYGPGENPGTLVSDLVDSLQRGEVPQVTECENLWDFTYIDDCVRMLRMLGECPEAEGLYNLSAGEPRLLNEFVKEIRDMVCPGAAIAFGAKRANPDRTFWLEPDVTKIRGICGACRVPFRVGIQQKIR